MLLNRLNTTKFGIKPGTGQKYIGISETATVVRDSSTISIVPTPSGGEPVSPPVQVEYMVTENNNFLMTENDNNLIA